MDRRFNNFRAGEEIDSVISERIGRSREVIELTILTGFGAHPSLCKAIPLSVRGGSVSDASPYRFR